MLLLLVDTNLSDRLIDLHLSMLIMTVLTFKDVVNFPRVNTAMTHFYRIREECGSWRSPTVHLGTNDVT